MNKKYIFIGITIILIIVTLFVIIRNAKANNGEWDNWWRIDGGYARRIYDKENKLVCWIVQGAGIDCEPSLELGHPIFDK